MSDIHLPNLVRLKDLGIGSDGRVIAPYMVGSPHRLELSVWPGVG
jgi:hypothetical protein